jgi:hypothetical protein
MFSSRVSSMMTMRFSGVTLFNSRFISAVLPAPVAPAMATETPLLAQRERKSSSSSVAVPQARMLSLVT